MRARSLVFTKAHRFGRSALETVTSAITPAATSGLPSAVTRAVTAACVVAVAGCGGAPVAPQAPAASASVAPVAVAPPPPVDVTEVPAPPTLVASGRLSNLAATLATVHDWTQLPMPQSQQLTEVMTSAAIGPIVDMDQPIDFAVAVVGSGMHLSAVVAASAGIKDAESAKAVLSDRYKLVPGDNGVLVLQGLGHGAKEPGDNGDSDADDEDQRACELAPAFGASPVRLVCGLNAKSLAELGPWLTRTATRAASSSDLHVDLRVSPVRQTIVEARGLASNLGGSVLTSRLGVSGLRDLARSLVGEVTGFLTDADTASLDVAVAKGGVSASLGVRFAGATSVLTRVAVAHPERSGPPPQAFWQLPKETDSASFGRGIDAADLASLRELVFPAFTEVLKDGGLKDADRAAVVDALGKILTPSAFVYGSGLDLDAVKKAYADPALSGAPPGGSPKATAPKDDKAGAERAARALDEELIGWHLLEFEEPPARLAGALKDLNAALNRPAIAALWRAQVKDLPPPTFHAAPLPKGAALPKDAQHYVLEFTPAEREAVSSTGPKKPAPPPRPIALHVLLVPDGGHVWLGLAGNETTLASKIAGALSGTNTLAGRADLAQLKSATMGAGGFVSLVGVAELEPQLRALTGQRFRRVSREALEELSQLPDNGATAMPIMATAQPGSPPAFVETFQVPRATIDGAVSLILKHAHF